MFVDRSWLVVTYNHRRNSVTRTNPFFSRRAKSTRTFQHQRSSHRVPSATTLCWRLLASHLRSFLWHCLSATASESVEKGNCGVVFNCDLVFVTFTNSSWSKDISVTRSLSSLGNSPWILWSRGCQLYSWEISYSSFNRLCESFQTFLTIYLSWKLKVDGKEFAYWGLLHVMSLLEPVSKASSTIMAVMGLFGLVALRGAILFQSGFLSTNWQFWLVEHRDQCMGISPLCILLIRMVSQFPLIWLYLADPGAFQISVQWLVDECFSIRGRGSEIERFVGQYVKMYTS